MLTSLGEEEAHAALADGEAVVRCEFCGQSYRFSTEQIAGLFTPGPDVQPAPERTQ
jgi:molecular chaperone Hsp33